MTGDNKIGEPIDRKFKIVAKCIEHDHEYDDNHGMFFAAKDRGLLEAALPAYLEWCRVNAASNQVLGVELLIERIRRYQEANPKIVKVPDIDESLGSYIIKHNKDT